MRKSLLQRAKEASAIRSPKRKVRYGELELTLAYVQNEITLRQYAVTLGLGRKSNGSVTHRIGSVIRQAVASGQLRLVVIKK